MIKPASVGGYSHTLAASRPQQQHPRTHACGDDDMPMEGRQSMARCACACVCVRGNQAEDVVRAQQAVAQRRRSIDEGEQLLQRARGVNGGVGGSAEAAAAAAARARLHVRGFGGRLGVESNEEHEDEEEEALCDLLEHHVMRRIGGGGGGGGGFGGHRRHCLFASIRHKFDAEGRNTSWAIVEMRDEAAVRAVLGEGEGEGEGGGGGGARVAGEEVRS
jgi:hypothetical protein